MPANWDIDYVYDTRETLEQAWNQLCPASGVFSKPEARDLHLRQLEALVDDLEAKRSVTEATAVDNK